MRLNQKPRESIDANARGKANTIPMRNIISHVLMLLLYDEYSPVAQQALGLLASPSFIVENFCNRSVYRSLSKPFSCSNSLSRLALNLFTVWLPLEIDRRITHLLNNRWILYKHHEL